MTTQFTVEIRDYESGDGDYPDVTAQYIEDALVESLARHDSDGIVIVTDVTAKEEQ